MFNPDKVRDKAFQYYARLERLKRHVDKHYPEKISLRKAARTAGMGQTYFSTYFHCNVGVTFQQWLTGVRISHAKRLLQKANYSISQVALAVPACL